VQNRIEEIIYLFKYLWSYNILFFLGPTYTDFVLSIYFASKDNRYFGLLSVIAYWIAKFLFRNKNIAKNQTMVYGFIVVNLWFFGIPNENIF
jgi:hypothetical protein